MRFTANIPYREDEFAKLKELSDLFCQWHEAVSHSERQYLDYTATDLVFDGFYPAYFNQKIKVLFIGREARGISGFNYLELLWQCYTENKRVGKQTLNQSQFHRRMLYVAYSLNNGLKDWDDIPYADKIGKQFGWLDNGKYGLSFAFMNISKFSNDSTNWKSDWSLINHSVQDSSRNRNFIREELQILNPDIIITMNLGSKLRLVSDCSKVDQFESVSVYMTQNQKLLLDTYHFSSLGMRDQNDFIEPINRSILKYRPELVEQASQSSYV
jgi:hypothetical protein